MGRPCSQGFRMRAAFVLGGLLAWCVVVDSATAQTPVTFLKVDLDDATRRADAKLRRYLTEAADLTVDSEGSLEYGAVVDRLSSWNTARGQFVARITPYAFVAAEMLGADFEIIAAYVSRATGTTTNHAYFVVNRARFPSKPELVDVVEYLQNLDRPARFIYHNKFSTSSYFLPSLYLRSNRIFSMRESTEYLTAIHTQRMGTSSSDLVESIATGNYDLAAVWDGTKEKYETTDSLYQQYGSKVYFIQLPTTLPNDLLVVSTSLDSSTTARIRRAIRAMSPEQIEEGDFMTWQDFGTALQAREALGDLRWLAKGQRPAPVTVAVRRWNDDDGRVTDEYLGAARQAIRLSGTEFVIYDDDFHEHQDYVWTLEAIHDGAIVLRSRITGSDVHDQQFQLSFLDAADLTRRIGVLVRSRMHRIRYVWPYRTERPTVIRDVLFSPVQNAKVKVRRISWLAPHRNLFRQNAEFDATVIYSDSYKFELSPNFIDPDPDGFGFNPMSNVSYRVVLVRPVNEPTIFRVLTLVFLALLVAAAGAAFVELRRLNRTPSM